MPKILIIEDDNFLRLALEKKLKKEGFEVVTASDGEEGLQKIITELPDLVLLDIILPKKTGFGFLEDLKKDPNLKSMKNCIFCKIIKGKEPARIVYEDKDVICFLPKTIQVYGHTLIVPKKHYKDLYDIPEKLLSKLTITAKKLTLAYKKKIGATGVNLLHASGKDGQQSVFIFTFIFSQDLKMTG
jgi:histidine triad (HIT) family protein